MNSQVVLKTCHVINWKDVTLMENSKRQIRMLEKCLVQMMFIDSMICIFDLNERNLNSLKKKYKYEPDIQGTKLSKKKTAKTKKETQAT